MATTVILNKAQMGDGSEELGRRILQTFLAKALALGDLETILLFNGGVHLATKDSVVAQELTLLHDRGVDVLVCGTCVDFLGLRERLLFTPPSNMDAIIAAMQKASKVITL